MGCACTKKAKSKAVINAQKEQDKKKPTNTVASTKRNQDASPAKATQKAVKKINKAFRYL